MRCAVLASLAFVALALAGCLGSYPAGPGADAGGAVQESPDHDHGHGSGDGARDDRRLSTDRIVPRPPGTEEDLSLDFGPFVVAPGHDLNRVRLDIPADGGFVTEVGVRMIDPTTGEPPSHEAMHLHHAHWLGVEQDPADPRGYAPLVEWRWASGDERTRGNATAVADVVPDGPRYGIYIEGGEPQFTDFMLHNRMPATQKIVVRLAVTFVHGSSDRIEQAQDCDSAPEDARCRAGETFHDLEARLWGGTFDVPREAEGDGTYVWPPDRDLGHRWQDPVDGQEVTVPYDGTIVVGAGHLHRNGKQVIVANLGPEGSGCEADVDGDGWPGVTLYRSRTEDVPAEAWPHSGAFQVTATQPGWRAPVHEGDRLTLWGTYANRDQSEEDAMAFGGVYTDTRSEPKPADHGDGCDVEALAPYLLGDAPAEPGYTMKTRHGHHPATVCNRVGLGADLPTRPACNRPTADEPERVAARTVHIQGFTYTPGDVKGTGPTGHVPVVAQGESLTWVNQDAALGIRHTVTSCRWPCNGPTTANYPQSSGAFDSEKIGNADPLSGGASGPEDLPAWTLDTSDLEPGLYAYYDRVHPWMRGWFEVVEPGAALLG